MVIQLDLVSNKPNIAVEKKNKFNRYIQGTSFINGPSIHIYTIAKCQIPGEYQM